MRPSYALMKVFWRIHLKLYLWSSGRLGNTLRGLPVLILTTTGKKTGLSRTNALMYLPHGKDFAVIASNLGEDHHPAWWINLKAQGSAVPSARVKPRAMNARRSGGR